MTLTVGAIAAAIATHYFNTGLLAGVPRMNCLREMDMTDLLRSEGAQLIDTAFDMAVTSANLVE